MSFSLGVQSLDSLTLIHKRVQDFYVLWTHHILHLVFNKVKTFTRRVD